jgi:tight adherence protein C
MIQFLVDTLQDTRLMAMLFAAVAAGATVLTLAMPLVENNPLEKRMKSVGAEREKIRQRERERLAQSDKISLRQSPKQYMQTVVHQFNLNKWLGQEEARDKLVQAGYRGQAPYVSFLFFRLISPAVALAMAAFYMFVMGGLADKPTAIKGGVMVIAVYFGMQLPYLLLKN